VIHPSSKEIMRTQLAASSVVETVVTLAAAAMMTLAGFAMVDDAVPSTAVAAALAAHAATPRPAG